MVGSSSDLFQDVVGVPPTSVQFEPFFTFTRCHETREDPDFQKCTLHLNQVRYCTHYHAGAVLMLIT